MTDVARTSPAIVDGRPPIFFELRPTEPSDLGFIRSSWKESHRSGLAARRLSWRRYDELHGAVIDELLGRADTYTLGAYDDNLSRPMLGWIAWTPGRVPAVHYVYVRYMARRQGLGTALVRWQGGHSLGDRLIYTHRGERSRNLRMESVFAASLGRRGVAVAPVSIQEFLATVR